MGIAQKYMVITEDIRMQPLAVQGSWKPSKGFVKVDFGKLKYLKKYIEDMLYARQCAFMERSAV